jgi:hypothetical protein
MIAAAGLATALLVDTPTAEVAAWSRTAASCKPAAGPAVPADYLLYHALVAPGPVLPYGQADTPRLHASCTPHKVIRT